MRKFFSLLNITVLLLISVSASAANNDQQIKQQIIAKSIASYPGNCPCPYNVMKNGRSCGKRSAYSKPGGYSPICYEKDVTPQMIENYKQH